jgi:hypothetical protein
MIGFVLNTYGLGLFDWIALRILIISASGANGSGFSYIFVIGFVPEDEIDHSFKKQYLFSS